MVGRRHDPRAGLVGGTWADGEGPEDAGPDSLVLVTPGGHAVRLRDESGAEAIEIEAASGAKLVMDGDGVTVSFGSQKLALTRSSVVINDGALEVM